MAQLVRYSHGCLYIDIGQRKTAASHEPGPTETLEDRRDSVLAVSHKGVGVIVEGQLDKKIYGA
jgi:hypothetical protein